MKEARSRVAWALMNRRALVPNEAETVLDYFETVGFYARNGLLDNDLLWNDLSDAVRCYWNQLGDYALMQRRANHDATLWENFEWLDQAMAVQERERHLLDTHVTAERISRFLRSEVSRSDLRELVRKEDRGH